MLIVSIVLSWAAYITAADIRGRQPGLPPITCNGAAVDVAQINDDYCDCGSDEPGTSACSGFASVDNFFCRNQGAESKYIFASRVNDDICDCCDTSDESFTECPNTCDEEGAIFRQRKEEEQRIAVLAIERKQALLDKVAVNVAKWEQELKDKKTEVDPLKATLAERKEKVTELQSIVDAAREVRREKEEAEKAAKAAEETQPTEEVNLEVEDLQEKIDNAKQTERDGMNVEETKELHEQPMSEYAKWADKEAEPVANDADKLVANDAPDVPVQEPDDKIAPDTNTDEDPDEAALSTAKAARQEAERALTDIENAVSGFERKLDQSRNLGNYASLIDECFTVSTGGFKYEVCFFEKATQDGTNIGTWDKMENGEALFSHGSRCPGDTHRSLSVRFLCGAQEELIEVLEPSMCTYTAQMKHPIACNNDGVSREEKEEL